MSPRAKFIVPLCLTPKNSPGPRSFKSSLAISNPSFEWPIIESLSIASSFSEPEINTQYDCAFPLPTRPRSWWSCARPKRSAFSITITVAFGTSTPTSTTVVETNTWISFFEKRSIISFFSVDRIWPFRAATVMEGGSACESIRAYSSTFSRSIFSLSSIIGQMT